MPPLQTVAVLRTAVPGFRAPLAGFSRLDRDLSPLSRRPRLLAGEGGGVGGSPWTRPRGKRYLPPSAAVAAALIRVLARRPSPASALPLCVPNLPPWQQCGWCESLRGRSHYKRLRAERPLAPRAGSTGAGQAAPPPPPPRRAQGLQVPCLLPGLCSDPQPSPYVSSLSPCTWSLAFSELKGR